MAYTSAKNRVAAEGLSVFILDVDGVMTDGLYYYTADGKVMKRFGPDDHDALRVLRQHIDIRFVTGDRKGLPISHRRIVDDMGYPLDVVSTIRRIEWIAERYPPERVAYMGDGIFDTRVFQAVGYALAPADADPAALTAADYVTARPGGRRAVAEACLHLMERFYVPFDPLAVDPDTIGL